MKPAFHIVHSLLLAALLVLTGQALAIARGAPLPAGQVELCTGTGPVMVHVDRNGQPVSPPHYCPEGVTSLLQAVALPDLPQAVPAAVQRLRRVPISRTSPSLRRLPALARGPPPGLPPVS